MKVDKLHRSMDSMVSTNVLFWLIIQQHADGYAQTSVCRNMEMPTFGSTVVKYLITWPWLLYVHEQSSLFWFVTHVRLVQIIDSRVLCVHGGLSPDVNTLDQIRTIQRCQEIPHSGAFCGTTDCSFCMTC